MNQEEIIGFDALYESHMKCKRGVSWKDSVAAYSLRATEYTLKLHDQLEDGRYHPRAPKAFTIESPKHREILSVSYRDRVYQRSLNDKAVYPQMSKSFIYDNGACQKGKGTDFCRNRLDCFLHRFYRRHGRNGFVLQIDIKGYYPNMSHRVVEETFHRKLDAETYARTVDILRSQYPGDKGYNPGSQIVQIAGISVLDRLDHYAKEQLRAKYYIRYMDDIILISESKDELAEWKSAIVCMLAEMEFELNDKKTSIYPLKDGIKFLGFTFKLSESGKVLKLIDPKNVKAERKKLRRLVALALKGERTKKEIDESYAAWKNHASKGNSYRLIQRMDAYYNDLWRRKDENLQQN